MSQLEGTLKVEWTRPHFVTFFLTIFPNPEIAHLAYNHGIESSLTIKQMGQQEDSSQVLHYYIPLHTVDRDQPYLVDDMVIVWGKSPEEEGMTISLANIRISVTSDEVTFHHGTIGIHLTIEEGKHWIEHERKINNDGQ